jgi:hypothetical protein
MVQRLRSKLGGDTIPVMIGNMADVAVEGRFRLNTIFGLLTQRIRLPASNGLPMSSHRTARQTYGSINGEERRAM